MTESSRGSGASLGRAIALARAALQVEPSGLLTDFDGTLSPIVADPELARLVDGADGALGALASRLAVVAIITGRAAGAARRMTGVPGLLVVGNHGVEWLEPNSEEATVAPGAIRARLESILQRVPTPPGVFLERKGLSATIHYRAASDPAATRDAIVRALGDAAAESVEVRHGRMSVELRPTGLGDKGRAARQIVERHALRGVVVMGDDLTDLDMFGAVAELRAAGGVTAAIIAVGGADGELPAAVRAAADVTLRDPAEAALLLAALSDPARPDPRTDVEATT
ncbi:MAG: trehalose-phosphatase [Chloroflexi bacterium]|nr:trehalose-phosphatase [Chloroflexota bacterium]